ncbi:unnamed protein product [Spirodela intermedia]|uniref:Uncharacterized protein n=1 Tax=Spirodela intermedia TaxID=51605 RepID=A0ABN7ECW1_SPIIN|nr:unnamed protein product [Spirodela intermedia]
MKLQFPLLHLLIEMVHPALDEMLNVLKACSKANVRWVFMVSSLAAILRNPKCPFEKIMDEDTV